MNSGHQAKVSFLTGDTHLMCQEGDVSWGYRNLVFGTVLVFSGATISQDGFLQYSGFVSLALSSPCLSYWTALAPPLLLCFSESSPKSSFLFSCSYFIIHSRFSFYHRKLELEIVKRTPTIIEIGNTMCAPLHLWVCLPRNIAWNASSCWVTLPSLWISDYYLGPQSTIFLLPPFLPPYLFLASCFKT